MMGFAALCVSCKPKDPPSPPPEASTATASAAAPSTAAPPSATPSAPSASSASAPRGDLPRCKALDKGRAAALGTRTTAPVGFEARDGGVYWLGFSQPMAKVELVRFGRDGAKPTELGSYKGPGEPKSFVLAGSSALFSIQRAVIQIPLAGGEPVKLATDFPSVIAANATHAFGVRCDKKTETDTLVRVSLAGGDVETAASWPRTKGRDVCDYKGLAVDASHAFVGDWGDRRVLSVALADGSTRQLTTDAYPSRFGIEQESLVFNGQNGIYRVAKTGGEPKQLTRLGGAPFSTWAWDSRAIYVLETLPYSKEHSLVKVPREGGKEQQLEGLSVPWVLEGPGLRHIAVDDACVYFAVVREAYSELMARPK